MVGGEEIGKIRKTKLTEMPTEALEEGREQIVFRKLLIPGRKTVMMTKK